ncbi:hypothetical protein MUK42_05326 [Musa troglodytarum]|uniref:Uncharacterized protein n=1 Tax=Musa troglodytarum TaxID=320322 RepID=A0A9E7GW82_9LILI|nr:hypothetical protein MUK42_05326 [Musa troglodytarum]
MLSRRATLLLAGEGSGSDCPLLWRDILPSPSETSHHFNTSTAAPLCHHWHQFLLRRGRQAKRLDLMRNAFALPLRSSPCATP